MIFKIESIQVVKLKWVGWVSFDTLSFDTLCTLLLYLVNTFLLLSSLTNLEFSHESHFLGQLHMMNEEKGEHQLCKKPWILRQM